MRYLLSTILLVLLFSNSSTAQDRTIFDEISRIHIEAICNDKGYDYRYQDEHHVFRIEGVLINGYITDNDNLKVHTFLDDEVDYETINYFNADRKFVKAVKLEDRTMIKSVIVVKGVTANHIDLKLKLHSLLSRQFANKYFDQKIGY